MTLRRFSGERSSLASVLFVAWATVLLGKPESEARSEAKASGVRQN